MKKTLPDSQQEQPLAGIINFLDNIHPITDASAGFIQQKAVPQQVKKGKYLRSPVDKPETLYFILKGAVRGFIKDEEIEITTWICEENSIVGSIRSLGLEIDTEEYLQALEDTCLLAISRESIDEWYNNFYDANILGRKILEIYYRDAEERAFLCRLPSAEKRYQRFIQTRPCLLGRIPLKYIASYLGMKLETLSRIRSKFLEVNPANV